MSTLPTILANVKPADREPITKILAEHGLPVDNQATIIHRNSMVCPALPTCGLALTEAERMHAEMVDGFDALLKKHGMADRRISVRITGCPNGCARTYAGDIGIVGRMPGFYALFVGGDFEGTRLNFKLLEKVPHEAVISSFDPLFAVWASDGLAGEGFGDFCHRIGPQALLEIGAAPAGVA